MKRIISVVLLCAALVAPAVAAPTKSKARKADVTIQLSGKPADGPMGIGVFMGQPSGVTFEMDLSAESWLDFKAAWDFSGTNSGYSIFLQGNYEYAFPGMVAIEDVSFIPFVGGGVFVNVREGATPLIGVRVPVGIAYRFRNIPLELFLEAGIDIALSLSSDPNGSGGLGVRYRF